MDIPSAKKPSGWSSQSAGQQPDNGKESKQHAPAVENAPDVESAMQGVESSGPDSPEGKGLEDFSIQDIYMEDDFMEYESEERRRIKIFCSNFFKHMIFTEDNFNTKIFNDISEEDLKENYEVCTEEFDRLIDEKKEELIQYLSECERSGFSSCRRKIPEWYEKRILFRLSKANPIEAVRDDILQIGNLKELLEILYSRIFEAYEFETRLQEELAHHESFKNFPIRELWRLFIDGKHQGTRGKFGYEDEPGHLSGCYGGFLFALKRLREGGKIDCHLLRDMHAECFGKAYKNITTRIGLIPFPVDFRRSRNGCGFIFLSIDENASSLGVEEIKAQCVKSVGGMLEDKRCLFKLSIPEVGNTPLVLEFDELVFNDKVEAVINGLLDECQSVIERTISEREKGMAISKCIANLNRMHVFNDGNIRVICFILTNILRMRAGLVPVIWKDPNVLDGFSLIEITDRQQEGSKTFLSYKVQEGEGACSQPAKESEETVCLSREWLGEIIQPRIDVTERPLVLLKEKGRFVLKVADLIKFSNSLFDSFINGDSALLPVSMLNRIPGGQLPDYFNGFKRRLRTVVLGRIKELKDALSKIENGAGVMSCIPTWYLNSRLYQCRGNSVEAIMPMDLIVLKRVLESLGVIFSEACNSYQYEELLSNEIKLNPLLDRFPACELWRLFIAGKDQTDKGRFGYENEPGYLSNCFKGFLVGLKMLRNGVKLDVNVLRTLHDVTVDSAYKFDEKGTGLKLQEQGFTQHSGDDAFPHISVEQESQEISAPLYKNRLVINQLFEQCYIVIGDSQRSIRDKELAIAECILSIERMQLFSDANCRTSACIVTNILRLQAGLSPVIWDDLDAFDKCSMDELVQLQETGEKVFLSYCTKEP